MRWIERQWYVRGSSSFLLWPLSAFYCAIALLRRAWFRHVARPATRAQPVIVVGNITVGGTGKTPLVIWMARWLRAQGFRPGIVTRGYGGRPPAWPLAVTPTTNPAWCGDEPLLLARAAGCPVVADPERTRAADCLAEQHGVNVIVSDDGLQHYALARDIEIAVIDGTRRFGNGFCLPAGPLREPPWRLRDVDLAVVQGEARSGEYGMQLAATGMRELKSGTVVAPDGFRGRSVHAVAGIGHPTRFFDQLRRLGVDVVEHPFPDHHRFHAAELAFGDGKAVIMTAKDAVKCETFAQDDWWVLDVDARIDPRFPEALARLLKEIGRG
jgi:tetraacyldisaccharide 4'-kinase